MKKGKILVAEDNAIAAMAMANMLKGKILQLDVVKNAKELIEKYQTTYYDCILLNTWFQDSIKVTRKIRAQEATLNGKFTPIIGIFSEWVEDDSLLSNEYRKYFGAGMNDIFPQPLTEADIDIILRKYLL